MRGFKHVAATHYTLGKGFGVYVFSYRVYKPFRADMYASAETLALLVATLTAAQSAVEAAYAFDVQLTLRAKPLGVVTPYTAKRTPLHKDGSSYTASVVKGKFLDVKDKPLHQTVYS